MTVSPHPITITVKDLDNTSAKSGAKVLIRNVTKKSTSVVATANSSGIAIIDLKNMPLGDGQTDAYTAGDVVHIIAYDTSGQAHDSARYVIAGSSNNQTLYLNPIPYTGGVTSVRLVSVVTGNTDASTSYYTKVYAFDDGELLSHIETPASDSRYPGFGTHGKGCSGGFIVERENKAVLVTATYR